MTCIKSENDEKMGIKLKLNENRENDYRADSDMPYAGLLNMTSSTTDLL